MYIKKDLERKLNMTLAAKVDLEEELETINKSIEKIKHELEKLDRNTCQYCRYSCCVHFGYPYCRYEKNVGYTNNDTMTCPNFKHNTRFTEYVKTVRAAAPLLPGQLRAIGTLLSTDGFKEEDVFVDDGEWSREKLQAAKDIVNAFVQNYPKLEAKKRAE